MVSIVRVPPRARPDPTLRKLGNRVRILRTAKGWTQEELAGEAGVDRSYTSGGVKLCLKTTKKRHGRLHQLGGFEGNEHVRRPRETFLPRGCKNNPLGVETTI